MVIYFSVFNAKTLIFKKKKIKFHWFALYNSYLSPLLCGVDNVDLGTACGKYFRVSCLSIIDPGTPNNHHAYNHNAADALVNSLLCSYFVMQVILISSRHCLVITKTTELNGWLHLNCHKLLSRMNLPFSFFNYFPGPETCVLWNFVRLNVVHFFFKIKFDFGHILESN